MIPIKSPAKGRRCINSDTMEGTADILPPKRVREWAATTAIVWLAAQQIDKHIHRGAEGSNVAECHDALACLPAFLLRAARAAPPARHRKAQFGAWIDHGVEVDAEACNERPELGFCRMPARYRFIAKLAVVCHRVMSRIVCKRTFIVPSTVRAGTADVGRRSIDRQVQTPHRRCAARDLFSSVDTVVVGSQTTSLPALAVATGEARSPRPRRTSDPFGEYLSKDGEYAHRCPPWTLESLAKYSARCDPRH